jgi:sterol desaturase/sphingolipid hydroxylase (fatty acid hydroxylase superfamily)
MEKQNSGILEYWSNGFKDGLKFMKVIFNFRHFGSLFILDTSSTQHSITPLFQHSNHLRSKLLWSKSNNLINGRSIHKDHHQAVNSKGYSGRGRHLSQFP